MEHNFSEGDILPKQESDQGDSERIVVAKVVAMLVLSVVTFILGVLPTKLVTWLKLADKNLNTSRGVQIILSLLLCFGGGVLLCTTFLHILPEVRETITDLQQDGKIAETSFHLPELLMCCGFFTLYLVEELIHFYMHWYEDSKDVSKVDVIQRSFSARKCCEKNESVVSDTKDSPRASEDTSSVKILRIYPCVPTISTLEETKENEQAYETSDTKMVIPNHDTHLTSVRGFLIVLSLSIHELFEGLTIGLQRNTGYVWYLLGAFAAHKLVIAFCVGIELLGSRTKYVLILIYMAMFALVSPIGIGSGIGLIQDSGNDIHGGVPNAVLQGMASGTLMYVIFFEILNRERRSNESGLKQLPAILVGFGVMFGLLTVGNVR